MYGFNRTNLGIATLHTVLPVQGFCIHDLHLLQTIITFTPLLCGEEETWFPFIRSLIPNSSSSSSSCQPSTQHVYTEHVQLTMQFSIMVAYPLFSFLFCLLLKLIINLSTQASAYSTSACPVILFTSLQSLQRLTYT